MTIETTDKFQVSGSLKEEKQKIEEYSPLLDSDKSIQSLVKKINEVVAKVKELS